MPPFYYLPACLPFVCAALFVRHHPADNPVLQEALSRRAALVAAVEAADNDASALPEDVRRQQAYVSTKSDVVRVAGVLNFALSTQGWTELVALGRTDEIGPLVLQVGPYRKHPL